MGVRGLIGRRLHGARSTLRVAGEDEQRGVESRREDRLSDTQRKR